MSHTLSCFMTCSYWTFVTWWRTFESRGSAVGIATGSGLKDRDWSSSPGRVKNCSILHIVQNSSGTHPASLPTVTRALSSRIKRPGREAAHSIQLVPRPRNRGVIHPILHNPLPWRHALKPINILNFNKARFLSVTKLYSCKYTSWI
jgi:hypothetical protein